MFLLRSGSVGIYKGKGRERELISRIDAINFFDEMSAVIGGPRSATVEALCDETIVYAFRTPVLDALMSNHFYIYGIIMQVIRPMMKS